MEFGGAPGAVAIIVGSHALLYGMWKTHDFDWIEATPNAWTVQVYVSFLALQFLFARVMPGVKVKGRPLKDGTRLVYNCNGAWSWWVTLCLVATLHLLDVLPLYRIYEESGRLMTCAIVFGNIAAVISYFAGRDDATVRIHAFFMGRSLNPRVLGVDIKMWAEIRISWLSLFILTLGAADFQHVKTGYISPGLFVMILAHFLYANACHKGEECIPTTWDIFHEKWGWMMAFWNIAGVPFFYCYSSFYIANGHGHLGPSWAQAFGLAAVLGFAYYVWDTAQAQKNQFRARELGSYVRRHTFPQLPGSLLRKPRVTVMTGGRKLLVDGWWRYARKIHYTADVVMALVWGLATGTSSFLPYVYLVFFLCMIVHRAARDDAAMRQKYGEDDYNAYRTLVPHWFVPGIF